MKPAAQKIREWREQPALFCREVLRVEEVDDWQLEVLDAITRNQRIALKASKGPGKSTVLAWILWWFMATRLHPKVVATSISGDNLRDGLWSETSKWQRRSPLLQQAFQWSAERIVNRKHPETWWASARQWSKSADPSQQANTLAGIHADAVLFLVDESGGIPDAVVAAAEAGLANADPARGTEALLIQAGNPTELSGPLYRACTRERHLWWVKEISGDPDDPRRAKRVSMAWAREQKAKWGEDHPFYLVNVLGKFPPGQSNTLLGVDDAQKASQRVLGERDYVDEVKVLGVDVARFGDDRTVLFLRQGRAAFRPKVYRNIDTMQTAGEVARVIEKQQPDATFIDVTGVGAGVVDRLHALGFPVVGVDFGGRANQGKYANRRCEMWWNLADWVRAGGCIPDDSELISELCAPTYSFDPSGKLKLETKNDMKARGISSPDKADALALTFAAPVASRSVREQMFQSAHGRNVQHDFDPLQGA